MEVLESARMISWGPVTGYGGMRPGIGAEIRGGRRGMGRILKTPKPPRGRREITAFARLGTWLALLAATGCASTHAARTPAAPHTSGTRSRPTANGPIAVVQTLQWALNARDTSVYRTLFT